MKRLPLILLFILALCFSVSAQDHEQHSQRALAEDARAEAQRAAHAFFQSSASPSVPYLQRYASDPASPGVGRIYINTTSHTIKFWNGSAWKTLADTSSTVQIGRASCREREYIQGRRG